MVAYKTEWKKGEEEGAEEEMGDKSHQQEGGASQSEGGGGRQSRSTEVSSRTHAANIIEGVAPRENGGCAHPN